MDFSKIRFFFLQNNIQKVRLKIIFIGEPGVPTLNNWIITELNKTEKSVAAEYGKLVSISKIISLFKNCIEFATI